MLSILPKNNPHQRLRVQRQLIASSSYLLFLVLLAIFSFIDLWPHRIPARTIEYMVAVVIAVNLLFYLILRTGYNLRFSDPSLTLPQLAVGVGVATIFFYYADDNRSMLLLLYPSIFLFGMLRLSIGKMLMLSVITVLSYALMGVVLWINRPDSVGVDSVFSEAMLLGALLPWYALMGGFISRLRQKLQDVNKNLAKALETINALAIRDDLTQVYNRRYLMEFLHQQKNAADRGSKAFAINLLDLDYFKQINDTYGHAAGDLVLKQFASMLKNQLRGADIIARYGGEEFVLVLTGSDLSNAAETAERLRRNTSELVFPGLEGKIKLTISVGVTQYVVSESVEALLSRADNALYQSKREGRDRVTVFQGHNSAKLPV